MRSTLSAVVCCYSMERWDLLQRTLASLRAQVRPIDQLVVVVDHNDLLYERLRAMPDTTVVRNDGRRGLSDARNAGIRAATCDVVGFLDDDVQARPSWSLQLMRPYGDDHVLGVGGMVVPDFEHGRPGWLVPELDWVVGCTYVGHRSTRGPVRNFIGANMSFRRSIFDTVAGFRNDLGRTGQDAAGCEETELCIRATRELGGEMFYEPDAIVEHFVPDARATRAYLRKRCRAEGRSKALIAGIAGRERGLASERSYVTHVLPAAVLRELAGIVLLRPRGGFGRIRTIVEAVVFTVLGYLEGRLAPRAPQSAYAPVYVTEIDVDHPVDIRPGAGHDGRPYARLFALARRFGKPLGTVTCDIPDGGLPAQQVSALVASRFGGDTATAPATAEPETPHPAPLVSVVIATRDRPDALERCLESLAHVDYPAYEVIVVDNRPATSDTADLVARLAPTFPGLHYVREAVAGLGRAHNRGLEVARGEIVAFTDDDVVVDAGWLRAIVGAFEPDPGVACVTGMIMPAELDTQSQAWIEGWAGFGKGTTPVVYVDGVGRDADPLFPFAAGMFGSGANMAMRAAVLRELGGFDPALGAGTPARGGDDLAMFFDVIEAGYAIAYEPAALVWHRHRADYAALREQAFGYGVGMGAYATHVFTKHPHRVWGAMRVAGRAAHHYFAPGSAKNGRRPADFPGELVWRERAGLVAGPFSYARSRR